MRDLSDNVKTLAKRYDFEFSVIVAVRFAQDPLLMTDYYDDITFNGEVYSSDNLLISIDPPRLSNVVDREVFKIVLDDSDRSLRDRMEQGMSGVSVSVTALFHNTTGAILGSYLPGEILTDVTDSVCVYDGVIDTYGMTGEDCDKLTIECAAPTSSLGLVKTYFTAKAFAKRYFPDDTSYDAVYAGSATIELLWGRAR